MDLAYWGHLMAAWKEKQAREVHGAKLIVTALYNVHRDATAKPRPFTMDELFVDPDKPLPELDEEQVLSNFQAFIAEQEKHGRN